MNACNNRNQTALHIAVNKEHFQTVQLLINLGVDINIKDIDGDTCLHDAIIKRNDPITETIIQNTNSDLTICNNNGFNPIHYAVLYGYTRLV
jgi:E3 ubiquitin-protein ligase mind-bomb